MTDCYVAFLDLMGVTNLVKVAAQDPVLCARVVSALKATRNTSTFRAERRDLETGEERYWSLQVQAVSDCVVLFIPVESGMLSWLLSSVRRLHDQLLRLNVPVRGGITIGPMHWESEWSERRDTDGGASPTPVAFGPGLVAAYHLENGTAVYPRILIASSLHEHVHANRHSLKSFPLGPGKLPDYLRQDFDGLYHFDVLHPEIDHKDVIGTERGIENGAAFIRHERDKTSYTDWLQIVRQFIVDGQKNASGEKLEAKYMWLARYFNEKSRQTPGVPPIRWFEDVAGPEGITLSVTGGESR